MNIFNTPKQLLAATVATLSLALGASACSLHPITENGVRYERDGTAIALRDSGAIGWVDLKCDTTKAMLVQVVDPNWIVITAGEVPTSGCADMFLQPGEVDLESIPRVLRG